MLETQLSAVPNIPGFKLLRLIGEGGFGRVWLSENETTGRLRALKLIPLVHGGGFKPAEREIASITRLERHTRVEHSNLLKIDHVGRTAEYLFYVMDPADDIDGSPASNWPDYRPATLRHKLEKGPLPSGECLEYAEAILAGLSSLHTLGMVHRDIKPANCLFVDGVLKLADFGLLTVADSYTSRLGTEAYMPPDGRMDTRADVYAAGLVIYEMISGRPCEDFPQLGRLARDVAADPILQRLNHVSLLACRRNGEDRPADASEMLAALEAPHSEKTEPNSKRHKLLPWLILLIVSLFAANAVGILVFRDFNGSSAISVPSQTTEQKHEEKTVAVSFFTEPPDALVLLDGELLLDADGWPRTTPCTAEGILPRRYKVVLRSFGRQDHNLGEIDFAKTHEVRTKLD